ncbi:hypothetical protein GY45DRAFT_1368931 [Cubamyces sp. BRFM 1775]|nr:hypothetical protein GY45DRAFT_1368931 [Cubamyces sp. BRFM 1775]
MQSYTTTSLIGGQDGEMFQDIFIRDANGMFLVNGLETKPELNVEHPIRSITLYSRFVVDGISVTYQLANGENMTLDHGLQDVQSMAVIDFNDQERLVGVFGSSGFHPWYRRNVILTIGFILFGAATATTRVVDPFKPEPASSSGEVTSFYASDVLAFGGFHRPGSDQSAGINGLVFHKNVGVQ